MACDNIPLVVALKILLDELVRPAWAGEYSWDDRGAAESLADHHAAVARDFQTIELESNTPQEFATAVCWYNMAAATIGNYTHW